MIKVLVHGLWLWTQGTESSLLVRRFLARASATMVDSLPLWMMSIPFPMFIALRMKLMMKVRFHGLGFPFVHQFTALTESDSTNNLYCWRCSYDLKIRIALRIARIYAWLISTYGIGLENKHMNSPSWFLMTPPIADLHSDGSKDASTFHFK